MGVVKVDKSAAIGAATTLWFLGLKKNHSYRQAVYRLNGLNKTV